MSIHNLHPDIVAFWERTGFKIKSYDDYGVWSTWNLCDGPIIKYTVAVTYADKNMKTKYYFKNKEYSEKEMLKLIKLKAFI